jgi:DNA-binding transcriptional LysR family regulator
VFNDSRCVCLPLRAVENAWMCVPELYRSGEELALADLSAFPMLMQGARSGTGLLYSRWLAEQGVHPQKTVHCESLVAQIGFTLSGLGISYLPYPPLRPLVESGRLAIIPVKPRLPQVRYACYYRVDRSSKFKAAVAQYASACCDFGSMFLQI